MQTAMRDTSLAVYHAEIQPTLNERQQRVYEVIQQKDQLTDKEIARELGWEINTVTPRRGELEHKGLVFDCGTRKCSITGRIAHIWTIKRQNTLFF